MFTNAGKPMKRRTKILLGILAFLLLLVAGAWIFLQLQGEQLVRSRLQTLVKEQTNGRYQADFRGLTIHPLSASLRIRGISLRRDSSVRDTANVDFLNRFDLDFFLERLVINDFNWRKYLEDRSIAFGQLRLDGPQLNMRALVKALPDSTADSTAAPPADTATKEGPRLMVGEILVDGGAFSYTEAEHAEALLSVNGLHLGTDSIAFSPEDSLQLNLANWSTTIDQVVYQVGDYTATLRTHGLRLADAALELDSLFYGVHITPLALNAKHGYLKSWIETNLGGIRVEGLDIQRMVEEKVYGVDLVRVEEADFRLVRNRHGYEPPPTFKPLPVQMIRDIPVPLTLDSLLVERANIRVELVAPKSNAPGVITFTDSRIELRNLTNEADKLAENATMMIKAESHVMGKAPVQLYLQFHLDRPAGDFDAYARINPMHLTDLNLFFEREVFIDIASGDLERFEMQFTGNNEGAVGSLDFEYTDLKFSKISKERAFLEGKPASGLLISAANLIVPNNHTADKKRYKPGEIDLQRNKQRDFTDLLVNAIADGVLATWGFGNLIKPPDPG